jgi:hypothetical protein
MTSSRVSHIAALAAALLGSSASLAAGQFFKPDTTLTISSLAGWHVLGQAEWKVENGELVGRAKPGSEGGWLVMDRSLQDLGLFASFKCTGACKTGILLRAEKTQQGMRGVLVSLTEGDLASYRATLDSQGRILVREKVPTPDPDGPMPGGGSRWPALPGGRYTPGDSPLPEGVSLPALEPRRGIYKPGDWNTVNVLIARWTTTDGKGVEADNGTVLRSNLNGGGGAYSGIDNGLLPDAGTASYGPIALYVGGTGEVRFKGISYVDYNARYTFPKEYVSPRFEVRRLSEWATAFAASAADFNHDGVMDVAAGPLYWMGPDYSVTREIYPLQTYNPTQVHPIVAMYNFAGDFNGDGWPDVLGIRGTAGAGVGTVYLNPRGEPRRWDRFDVLPSVGNEVTAMKDVDGDGKPEVIHGFQGKYLAYSKPDPSDATKPWITTIVSEAGPWGANQRHGVGAGDVNGDGLTDILSTYGWWEQPTRSSGKQLWTYHPQAFGRRPAISAAPGGGEIGVYDVNGDGLNDVVTTMEAHGFGLSWFEQKRNAAGTISFVEHLIMGDFSTKNAGDVTFTEPHGAAFADIDGDGVMDIVTGKSLMHHFGYQDADSFGPAVLYWYRTVRNPSAPGGAEFVPELIHNRSGLGDKIEVADMNRDGTPDIVVSSFTGTYVLLNHYQPSAPR